MFVVVGELQKLSQRSRHLEVKLKIPADLPKTSQIDISDCPNVKDSRANKNNIIISHPYNLGSILSIFMNR